MKKSISIFGIVLTALGLMAFSWLNWNNMDKQANSDFYYNLGSKFGTTITKENLHKATSVLDIVPTVAEGWWKVSFQTVTVALLQDHDEIIVFGNEKVLNDDQIRLLQSTEYSSNFYIKARGKDKHPDTGKIEDYTYYFTVTPEKEAEYVDGQDALIAYLKDNCRKETYLAKEDSLERGMISFTVTKKGSITKVELLASSGYPVIDKTMVELITNAPGRWEPAADTEGKKIDQELVFSFGRGGC